MAIEAANLFVKIGADITSLQNGMKEASRSIQNAGRAMSQVGQSLTMGVTLPLVGVGVMAVKAGMEYETAMNVMQNNAGATAAQFAQLSDLTIQLGADVKLPGTSAKDAAEAMNELAKSGISVTDIIAGTRPVLEMSAAGNISNALAAEIASNAMNVFGLSGSDMARVADLMAASANASSAEITDMADAMKMSGSVMKMANIPIEDLATWLGQMANVGMKGSDAGTSLKQMMLTLMNPTDKAAGLMKDLGISVYDSSGKMKDARSIVAMFSDKLGGLTDQERDFTMGTLFGSDAVRAANTVFLSGVDAFDKMKVAVTKQGAASEAATARNKGLAGALDALNSAVETAYLKIKDTLDPVIRTLAEGLSTLVNRFTELDPGMQSMIVWGAVIAAALGPALMIFGAIATGLAAISAPMWVVIAAVGLLAVAWGNNWGGIQEKTAAVWAIIKPILDEAMTVIGKVWSVVKDGIQPGDINIITANLALLANTISTAFQRVVASIGGWIRTIDWQGLLNGFNLKMIEITNAILLWSNNTVFFTQVGNTIGRTIGEALKAIFMLVVAEVGSWFSQGGFKAALNIPMTMAKVSGDIVTGLVTGIVKGITGADLSGDFTNWLTSAFSKALLAMNPGLMLINTIREALGSWDLAGEINKKLSSSLPPGGVGMPGKASGGSVYGGSPYIVGERGPELFVPGASGTIIPNNKLSTGGTTINLGGITINGGGDASTVKQAAYNGVMAAARAMGAL